MLTDPPSDLPRLDLLLVGGLTVDNFADGTSAPGGSVLHAARAGMAMGHRVGAVVLAGPEPVAAAGLQELAQLDFLWREPAPRSIGFGHELVDGVRRLRFEGSGGRLAAPAAAALPAVVLHAPVADEVGSDLAGQRHSAARHAAIVQGWLRRLEPGRPAVPLPLSGLDAGLRDALAHMDLLVASREDLVAEGDEPERQIGAMRATFGPGPVLVVTDATDGAWVQAAGEDGPTWRVRLLTVVDDVPTTGAGDMFAALLVAPGWPAVASPTFLSLRTQEAMQAVSSLLERRR
jgi:sugar/nucleoside kinase (ribokinase family)